MMSSEITISVVTPFFNTARYLPECIESVLSQSYRTFEYLLIDNHSTDDSAAIAESYARKDARIRTMRTPHFLTQVQNYNFALTQISPSSTYCKIVQADDWLFRTCLEEMVTIAAAHPDVAVVSAYQLKNDRVVGIGLSRDRVVMSGREACRLFLMGRAFMFGSPTTHMYRADLVRARRPFYEEGRLHEDTEAVFELLASHQFALIHQVLSSSRVHQESITGSTRDFAPDALDMMLLLKRFGRLYLSAEEYEACTRDVERYYYASVARAMIQTPSRALYRYHREGLEGAGVKFRPLALARYLGGAAADNLLPPVLSHVLRRASSRIRGAVQSSEPTSGERAQAGR